MTRTPLPDVVVIFANGPAAQAKSRTLFATACVVVVLPLVVSVDEPVAGVSSDVGCASVTSKSLISV